MNSWEKYFNEIVKNLERVRDTQKDSILKAADLLAKCIENDGLIRVFGAGHSHIAGAEVFWRSATLANIHPIIESSISGSPAQVTKSQYVEKMPGYAKILVEYHRVKVPDVLIAVSNGGNNTTSIEFAEECQKRGVPVIAITNVEYSDYLKPLHHSGKKLMDFADVVLDNCSQIGDAAVEIPGFPVKVGAMSTVPSVGIINAILVETVDKLVKKGIMPDVYYNGNLAANLGNVAEHNINIVNKYFYRIRDL